MYKIVMITGASGGLGKTAGRLMADKRTKRTRQKKVINL
jgi:NADP-dependent 3-hydroxy acid dehydrogenase YdfG